MNTSETARRLARLRVEFNRLKPPEPQELAMSAGELKALVTEIKQDSRVLIDQLQTLSKTGQEPGLVSDVINRLERTLGQVKAQEST